MYKEQTERGFSIVQFKDKNGVACSLQKSSLATEDCIWIGANKIGIEEFNADQGGWINRPEFDESTTRHHFVSNKRMHLTREQVAELLPYLQRFVETGDF